MTRRSERKHRTLTTPTVDVLIGLNYYSPYVSGLTNVARDVAEYLVTCGRDVTVVTTQHEPGLPTHEVVNGVNVIRAKVLGRIDRAPISPTFVRQAIKLARGARVVNLHLPMPEAGAIARGMRAGTPLVLTYQCDPPSGLGLKSELVRKALDTSHRVAIRRSEKVVASSLDYAHSSRVLSTQSPQRVMAIPPTSWARAAGQPTFRSGEGRHVGFLGRLTSEKGADVLIRAFRASAAPEDRLLIAGEGIAVAGDSAFGEIKAAAGNDPRVQFLGRISDDDLANFYASIDVFCLPSTNSFEAFGIVQVEAMLASVPVIASDLPGVRSIVQTTDGGLLAAPGSVDSLADALTRIADLDFDSTTLPKRAAEHYGVDGSLARYATLFEELAPSSTPA